MNALINTSLTDLLGKKSTPPFLFVGSGLSRRYLGLECWVDLLKKFSIGLKDFEYYLGRAEGDIPKAASLLSEDFYEHWWKSEDYQIQRNRFKDQIKSKSDPLKIAIAEHLKSRKIDQAELSQILQSELTLLKSAAIDGIITTNWDGFLENIFSDFKTYIGQNQLLFSSPTEVAEIYKIHGCESQPDSMVLTAEDYVRFRQSNPYLMAKLLTVFVEHPVVFLGYSFSDSYVHEMLENLVRCLGSENIKHLQDNLIFVDHSMTESSFAKTILRNQDSTIPITLIRTDDFSQVFSALASVQRRVPAKVFRWVKEHLYEIVKTNDPTSKITVCDIDDEAAFKKAEVVLGIGVSGRLGDIGYRSIGTSDLVHDVLLEDKGYDPERILKDAFPSLSKSHRFSFPVFKYLHQVGIKSKEDFQTSDYAKVPGFGDRVSDSRKWYAINTSQFAKRKHFTVDQALAEPNIYKALQLLSYSDWNAGDLDQIKQFLVKHIQFVFNNDLNQRRAFMKCVFLYDAYKFGWIFGKTN